MTAIKSPDMKVISLKTSINVQIITALYAADTLIGWSSSPFSYAPSVMLSGSIVLAERQRVC